MFNPAPSAQGAYGTRTYQYDSVGNRTGRRLDSAPVQSITVISNSNRLDTLNSVTVSYDAAGNVLADGAGRTFAYNDLNRLSSASVSGQTVASYAYNAFGQRVRKTDTVSGQITVFAYAPGGQILTERRLRSDGTRESEREYLWLESMPIAMAERSYAADGTTVTASQFVYLHADHLDTPRLATDAAQRVVWRWRSDAFGIGTAETDPDGDSVETDVPLRFPGQYRDAETGLHYNYFRDYDPAIGRFVTSDPIGLNGGLNTYAYVGGNPLKYFDLYGLDAQMCYRPFYPIPQPYARHCFLEFDDGSSSSFDPEGTHEDPAPDWWPKSCQDTDGEENDDCLKKAMKKCKAEQYDFTGFNCCHCVERAMKECGLSIPRANWPNWPVNPGPQPGEPGYQPGPQYGVPRP